MFYLVIILFVAAAIALFLRQQSGSSTSSVQNEPEQETEAVKEEAEEEETEEEPGFVLSARPVTSPDSVLGATYSSRAPAGDSSPYGISVEPEKKAQSNLLRWCGRSGNIQIENFVIQGPVAYWSNGESSTTEPSCIDITLPVAFPQEGEQLPAEGSASYSEMTPLQRGIYLTWLSGARIQPPLHICYPSIWLYGIERRTIVDKLDIGLCLSEVFRLIPLMRWGAMTENLLNFISWLSIRVWLPEEDLLALCERLNTLPDGLLGILLNSFANSRLPLPSALAFTLMRTSEKLRGENAPKISHSDELLRQFTPIYKEMCKGGLILTKPQAIIKISYTPTNPTIQLDKKSREPIDIPNFFEDTKIFKPLINAWQVFLTGLNQKERLIAFDNLEERPDFEGFISTLRPEGSDLPLIATLGHLGDLMKFDTSPESKITGKERKFMVDTAQVEGWQIVPDLGISGRLYSWDDEILFLPLEPGTQLSQAYRISSFILEFICAITEAREERLFEPLRQRLNDYFNLTEEDNIRLEEQRLLNLPTQYGPEYYGEFISMWLSEQEKIKLKNFLLNVISFMPELNENPAIKSRTCLVLGVSENTDPSPDEESRSSQNLGDEILKIMSLLFKNN